MWLPRPGRDSRKIDSSTFFSPLGRVAGHPVVSGSPDASSDTENPNNQVVEPYHHGKYTEPNRNEWRGIAHCVVLVR